MNKKELREIKKVKKILKDATQIANNCIYYVDDYSGCTGVFSIEKFGYKILIGIDKI